MKARELPGALVLGLLASLIAHTAGFGGEHTLGGAYHSALESLAFAGALGLAVPCALAAWKGAGRFAEGSVIGAHLTRLLPGAGAISVFAAAWFLSIESLEPSHAEVSAFVMMPALIVASWLVRTVAAWFVRSIAQIAFALVHASFACQNAHYVCRARRIVRASGLRHGRRRFARPPPSLVLLPTP